MNKNKFNLRKMIAVAICLVSLMAFVGCAVSSPRRTTSTTNRWAAFEILPPSIVQNARQGQTIMSRRLADGSTLIVYRDFNIPSIDGDFVYHALMRDFGWQSRGNYWRANPNALIHRSTVPGNLYVNPYRRMAIYFFPDNTRGVFGVRIE